MSHGYTGLILDIQAKLGCFNRVKVYALETFETSTMITSSWHKIYTKRFKRKFTALRFIITINKGIGK